LRLSLLKTTLRETNLQNKNTADPYFSIFASVTAAVAQVSNYKT